VSRDPHPLRQAIGWAVGLLLAWVAIRLAAPRVLRRFFHVARVPASATPASVGLHAEDVIIPGPRGRRLRAWFIPADETGRQPAALVLHGWTGNASLMLPIASPLRAAGLHVLLLDARCHGRSDDDDFSSMPSFADDAEHALAWLRTDPRVDPDRVVLVGHSVGAGACLLVASRDARIAAVVSISSMADPAAYMRRAMRRQGVPKIATRFVLREIERAIGHRFTEFAPIVTISRLRAPVLLIHGAADPIVPLCEAKALHRVAPPGTDLLVVPEADHSAVDRFLAGAPAVTDFLRHALAQSTNPTHRAGPAAP